MFSLTDYLTAEVHVWIERLALDEVAISGRLVAEILKWLHRENHLFGDALTIRGKAVVPSILRLPTLVVINAIDEIAPQQSVLPFVTAMPERTAQLITYEGEFGVELPHRAILVGCEALVRIWPAIIDWIKTHR
jgi:poly(3-hydroxyalkanoate) synthetase